MRYFSSDAGSLLPAPLAGLLALLVVPFLAAGCGDDGALDGNAEVRVLVTDAPSDYIAAADIWVSAVYLQGGAMDDDDLDDDGVDDGADDDVPGRVFLFDDPENPKRFDLLLLRDGITEDLTGYTDVEPGSYGQLRLVVDSAVVTLAEGYAFRDGGSTSSLMVPSGSSSGIKVQLDEPVEVDTGEEVTIVVDFDVDRNFVIQGNPETPAGIQGVLFTPLLQEISREETDDGDGSL